MKMSIPNGRKEMIYLTSGDVFSFHTIKWLIQISTHGFEVSIPVNRIY